MIIRLWAWITGRPLVWLRDHDGDVTLSIAYVDAFDHMRAKRYWPFNVRNVDLLPGGVVGGGEYVVQWKYAKEQAQ